MSRDEPDAPVLTDAAGVLCTALVPLSRSRFAVVSEQDEEAVGRHRWTFHRAGYAVRCVPRGGVGKGTSRQRMLLMHREIAATPTLPEVDHRNGRRTDNRRQNLRPCTTAQNQHNVKLSAVNTSGYRGVYWNRQEKKWKVALRVNGKKIHLGYHATAEAAARAYDVAARQHFGEFASVNFPDTVPQARD